MRKLILEILNKMADAFRDFRAMGDLFDEETMSTLSKILEGVAGNLNELYEICRTQNWAKEAETLAAIAEFRALKAGQLTAAHNLLKIEKEAAAYTKGGLPYLPRGQNILSLLTYNRHLLNKLKNWGDKLKDIAKLLNDFDPENKRKFGREFSLSILNFRYGIQKKDQAIQDNILHFEKTLASKTATFSPEKTVGPTVFCGTSNPPLYTPVECIAVYRGIHFRRDYFSEMSVLQQKLAMLDHIPSFSGEVRKRAKVDPGLVEREDKMDSLIKQSEFVEETLLERMGKNIKQHWGKKVEADQYYSLLQRYINSYGKFVSEIKKGKGAPKLFTDLGFTQVPFVSFSFNPIHSVRYALGVKTPFEQSAQRRRTGELGELYIYLIPLTPRNVKRMNNILYLSAKGKVSIKYRILNEAELNVLGGMESRYLVGRMVVGCSGWSFYDPLEKTYPDDVEVMSTKNMEKWENKLATSALGVALTEAKELGWKIRGYEEFPDVTFEEVHHPGFGQSSIPDESFFEDDEIVAMKKEIERTEKIIEAMKKMTSARKGNLRDMSLGEGFAEYPRNIEEYLDQQNITEPDGSLFNLLEKFDEGWATPIGNNCILHTLTQLGANDPNVAEPDYSKLRKELKAEQQRMQEQPPHINLQQANSYAAHLGLLVTVYAIGHGGAVTQMGEIGIRDGKKVSILHFGAHFIPLWPK